MMEITKKALPLLFVAIANIFALQAFSQSQSSVIDEVLWVVGDEAILKSDVENARLEAAEMGQSLGGDPYCVIPEQLAVQKLFLHQAAIDSVSVTDADVFQMVEERLEEYIEYYGSREKMEERSGKTYSQIREKLFNSLKENSMVSEVKRSLVKDIKVTPAQVRNFFKDMPSDSIPYIPTKLELQIIQRFPKFSNEEIERVKGELRDYTERINNGEDFAHLARLYSQDGSGISRGGDLGYMTRGQLVPEFAAVAFNLTNPKVVSKIVESEYGFHIIQLIDKKGEKVRCRHILRKPIVSDEAITECVNYLDTVADNIRKNVYTFDVAASKFSQDKDTRNNYGNMIRRDENDILGGSRFEMKDLNPAIAKQVANMKVGEVSEPFIMTDSKGKEVVAIVKLKNRINGHTATLKDDYQALHDVVQNQKSEDKILEWVREKQKTTYIRISDSCKNCNFQYPGWVK